LGMLTIMIPLQNWIVFFGKDHKKSRFLGIWDHQRRILTIFGFLRTSLVKRISLDGTLIFIKWNSSLTHSQLLEGFKWESQIENIGRMKSRGTLLGSQHYRGVEGAC
jgi:hypothetical protein